MAPRIVPMSAALFAFIVTPLLSSFVSAHIACWHPAIFGFNVTFQTFPYDNRPVAPLADLSFDQWWFHGHLGYPPHPEDVVELPVGKAVTLELACDKGATSYFASSPGGDIRQGDWPCPGQPSSQFHTLNEAGTKGCALAIARTPSARVNEIQPEDFVVFSVNHRCVWNRFTKFDVPADMPACPPGGCTCAWFWIHDYKSGSEQMYMVGFQCDITGARIDAPPLSKPKVARRCGADPDHGVLHATPSNCTKGAKQPLYWFQKERNNMFEGTYAPPYYNDLYDFKDGAQTDIFDLPSGSSTIRPASPTSSASPTSTSTSSSRSSSASSKPTTRPALDSGSPGSNTTSTSSSSSTTTSTSSVTPTPPSFVEQSSTIPTTTPAATTATCRERPVSTNRKRAISAHARRSRVYNSRSHDFGHS